MRNTMSLYRYIQEMLKDMENVIVIGPKEEISHIRITGSQAGNQLGVEVRSGSLVADSKTGSGILSIHECTRKGEGEIWHE